jgi:diguanylate cyclase
MVMDKADDNGKPDWRDKYLDALDAQDTLERKLTEQRTILSSVVARMSRAAGGQDDELDRVLDGLHLALGGSVTDVQPVLGELDKTLSQFEQRRSLAQQEIHQALRTTLQPLTKFPLPRALKKEIDDYLSQLPQRVARVRLYPALLQQLADIQQQALASQASTSAGFWQKLFNRGANPPQQTQKLITDSGAENIAVALVDADESSTPNDLSASTLQTEERALANDEFLPKISALLRAGLEHIDIPEEIGIQAQALQQQLQQPLSNTQMFSLLESAQALIIDAYNFSNRAFAVYLDNVNQELADIYQAINGAVHQQSAQLESAQRLESSVLQQMIELETQTEKATDLTQLKSRVTSQIGNIRQALDNFSNKEQDQQQLATQLQELAKKLQQLEAEAQKTRSALAHQRHKSLHDPLTELPNREAYQERVQAEFNRWLRYQHPLSLAICDLDHFKKINDTFGHQAGDRVLKVIGRSISKRLRTVDFFGRYGGEEFVAILPETNLPDAQELLEKIRAAIANTAFNYKEQPLAITLSIGVAEFFPGDTVESVFARADKALYAAKAAGRNRVVVAEPHPG